jgi:phosphocarrier protein
MKSFEYTITDEVGIHARPAGILVKEAKNYASTITLTNPAGKSADVRKLMALMSLGVKQGETVTVTAEGEDEDTAIAALEEFFKANL